MAASDRLVAVDSSDPILPEVVVTATEASADDVSTGTSARKFVTPRRLLGWLGNLAKARTVGGFNLRAGGTPKYHVDEGDPMVWINDDGSVFMGQNLLANYTANNAHRMHPDFLWDQRALRLFVRNITMGMIADPCDIALRRWGPDTGGFPYVEDGTGDGTFADLTGLGAGALVGQVRCEPAVVPYGGDQDTPGAQAEMTAGTIGFSVVDMPRRVTSDAQCSNAGKFEVNLTPKNSHDFRQTYFQIHPNGRTMLGNKAIDEGNVTALVSIRTHEGENNQQLITITNSPTGGTFKLIFWELPASTQAFYAVNTDVNFSTGSETATIAFDASAATVQTAIVNAITAVSGNIPGTATPWASVTNADVLVTGSAGGPWTVEFTGLLGLRPMFKFGKGTNALTGGTSPNFTVERVNEVGVATQANLHVLRLRGCTGQTGDYFRVIDAAGAIVADITSAGKTYLSGELEIDGALNHDGTTAGFFAVTPTTRPTAYTQTYATADKTHAAPTAAVLTVSDGAGTNDNTIGAITADASVIAAVQELADEINKLVADVADVKQVVNSMIDDFQLLGLLQ